MSYSPTEGRWMEQDPLGYIDGMNDYEFVGGNPINRKDPSGQEFRYAPPWMNQLGVWENYRQPIQGGVYGFGGGGFSTPWAGAEGGVGGFLGTDGGGLGFEGYGYGGGAPGAPFTGAGGWVYPSPDGPTGGYGPIGGYNFGPLGGEIYQDSNGQTFIGAFGGEGLVGGFGIYFSNPFALRPSPCEPSNEPIKIPPGTPPSHFGPPIVPPWAGPLMHPPGWLSWLLG